MPGRHRPHARRVRARDDAVRRSVVNPLSRRPRRDRLALTCVETKIGLIFDGQSDAPEGRHANSCAAFQIPSGSTSGENRVVDDEIELLRRAGNEVIAWTPSVTATKPLRAAVNRSGQWTKPRTFGDSSQITGQMSCTFTIFFHDSRPWLFAQPRSRRSGSRHPPQLPSHVSPRDVPARRHDM